MGRIILTILLVTTIGCSPLTVKTEVQESYSPVLYCPTPTIPKRPGLVIQKMSVVQRQDPGEVAKHYQATVQQLLGYSRELELELQKYEKASASYKNIQHQLGITVTDDGEIVE